MKTRNYRTIYTKEVQVNKHKTWTCHRPAWCTACLTDLPQRFPPQALWSLQTALHVPALAFTMPLTFLGWRIHLIPLPRKPWMLHAFHCWARESIHQILSVQQCVAHLIMFLLITTCVKDKGVASDGQVNCMTQSDTKALNRRGMQGHLAQVKAEWDVHEAIAPQRLVVP